MSKAPPEPVLEFLASIGATKTGHHAGRSLQEHLIATYNILADWQCDEHVQIAGLCHSIYGTDAFDTACLGIKDRKLVQSKIGQKAEELAFLFGAVFRDIFLENPAAETQLSRFDDNVLPISNDVRTAICDILLANELDLVIAKKGTGRPDKVLKKVGPIYHSIKPYLSKSAVKAYLSLTSPVPG